MTNSWENLPASTPLTAELAEKYIEEQLFRPSTHPEERVGVEFEYFVVERSDDQVRGIITDPSEKHRGILLDHARKHKWKILTEKHGENHLITGYDLAERGLVTFEPGKQLELSTACFSDFLRFKEVTRQTLTEIKAALADENLALLASGTYPMAHQPMEGTAVDRLLHPKKRYLSMAAYYESKGYWGEILMKHTAATQICCDNGQSPEEVAQRYVLGELLAPVALGTFAFSPFLLGKWGCFLCTRASVVKYHDPSAAGAPFKLMEYLASGGEISVEQLARLYTEFLMASRVVTLPNREHIPIFPQRSFQMWMDQGIDGTRPTIADLKYQLGYIFPEVRPKGFLELRSPDAQSDVWQFAPVVYYLGLMLSPVARKAALDLLMPYAAKYKVLENWEFAGSGLSFPYFSELAGKVMKLAIKGAASIDGELGRSLRASGEIETLKAFAQHFTYRSRVPAQDLVDLLDARGVPMMSEKMPVSLWHDLDNQWRDVRRNQLG